LFAQIAGSAMAISASAFRAADAESAPLQRLTLLHARIDAQQAELGWGATSPTAPRGAWPDGC